MRDERSKYRPAENGGAILSRRSLFELAGMAVASAAIPAGAAIVQPIPGGDSNEQGVSPVMHKLSRYMSEAGGRALPDGARSSAIYRGLWRQRGRDSSCLKNCVRPDRGGTGEWRAGTC